MQKKPRFFQVEEIPLITILLDKSGLFRAKLELRWVTRVL